MDNAAHYGRLRVSPRGVWPAKLTLRRGLSAAHVRPWNSHHSDASLRLTRGGHAFVAACVRQLGDLGAPSVFSPPMPSDRSSVWTRAGFSVFLELALLRLDLTTLLPPEPQGVAETNDLDGVARIDAAAFDDFWALDDAGLGEAMRSTRRFDVLSIGTPMAGFAIVGYGSAFSYLQRVAVEPGSQGRGLGTDLVVASAARARSRGLRTMFLNTQVDNEASLRLYRRLGFERSPDGLYLLRA